MHNTELPELDELDELTEENLGFSALSDGLGFTKKVESTSQTPPVVKQALIAPEKSLPTQRSQPETFREPPTGATLAGPVLPAKQTPKIAINNSAKTQEEPKEIKASISEPAAPIIMRTAAFAIDILLASLPWAMAFYYLGISYTELDPKIFVSFIPLYLFVYFLLGESLGGQSLGKILLKLKIVEDDKYQKGISFRLAFPRLICACLGLLFAGIGLLLSFWDIKHRCLHDKLTGTIVRRAI